MKPESVTVVVELFGAGEEEASLRALGCVGGNGADALAEAACCV